MFKSSNNQKSNTLGPQRSAAPLTPVGQWSPSFSICNNHFFLKKKNFRKKSRKQSNTINIFCKWKKLLQNFVQTNKTEK